MKILLFNRNEQYIATLKDVLSAKHTEELNGENVLEIETLDEIEKNQRLIYKDKYGYWHEFIVRGVEEERAEEGIIRRVFAEHSFYETWGDYIEDKRPYDVPANIALSVALEPTRWEVGIVDDLGINSTNFYHISAKEAVQKIAETWQGELRYRGRYVDLLARRGHDLGKRFTYTKDLLSITKTVHRDDVITALYGYGKGQEIVDEEGQPTGGFGRRIDFADINGGKAYVEDIEAKETWGRLNPDGTRSHVFGKVEFDDCEDPEELLGLTMAKLEELSKPLISYEASVIDLKAFGIEHEGVELGDTVGIIDREFNPELRLRARVVKLTRDLLEPENTIIVLGNFIPSIADSWVEQEQYINNFREKQGVWDRASIIESDGTINAQYLNNLVAELNAKMNALGGYVYISDQGEGLITYDRPDPEEATMAIQLLGGSFRIANSKLPNGEWNWRTFGDGNGFVADAFIGGLLKGGKVNFDLTNGTLLIGNSTEDYLLLFDGHSLKLNFGGKLLDERLDEIEESIEDIELTPGPQGPPGADGRGIVSTVVEYQVGTSGTTEPTGSWSSTVPSVDEGKYLWTRTTIKYTSGSDTITYSVAKQGEKGSQGQPGEKGADGVPTYLHVAYATDANGGGFSTTDPSGKSYLGTYTDTNEADSENWQDYKWVLIKGADGATGQEGPAGVGISSSTVTYAKSSSGTTSPTSGWSSTVPSANAGEFIWTRTDIEFSDGATQTIYSVGKIGEKGDKGDKGDQGPRGATGERGPIGPQGTSVSSVVEYYLATNLSSGVTTSTSGWGTTMQSMTSTNRYLWNYEKINFSDGTSDTTIPVIIGVYGDKGDTGSTGATGRSITGITEYYLATSASSNVTRSTSGWTTTMQTTTPTKKYLWNYEKITWSSGTTTTYTDPIIIGVHGDKGDKGDKGDQGPQGIQGPKGDNGQSQWVHIRYSANSNGSGMTTNPSSSTKYVGIAVTNSPTAPSYTGFTWSKYVGEDGAQGPQGIQGPKGDDGQPTYTWIKYADTPTSGMSNFPDGKKYIGMAFNKTTETESNNYSDYQWSLMPQNIEIGGRNYVQNSSEERELNNEYQGIPLYVDTIGEFIDETVTVSFEGRLHEDDVSNGKIRVYFRGGSSTVYFSPDVTLTDSWARYSRTMHITESVANSDNNQIAFHFGNNSVHGYIRNIKLERGNIATDWSPAPEDVDQNISDSQEYLRGEIDEVNAKVDDVIGLVGEEPVANIKQQLQDAFDRELEAINKALYGDDEEEEGILERLAALTGDTAGLYIDLVDQSALIESLTGKISIEGDTVLIGDVNASKGIRIKPDEIAFLEGESKVAWITGGMLYIDAGVFLTRLKIGNHVFQSVDGNPDITIVGYEP